MLGQIGWNFYYLTKNNKIHNKMVAIFYLILSIAFVLICLKKEKNE